ncbi:MAG: 2-oxo acid dehydrogenase subunit E2 [Acidilobaceae archaeon]|nr:2-oxo acid dehydrogenase subunit E2 [Acidilobaceae archaeon]MCX8165054.1 2-oxo acid dehydrogenase subunit E2 [Acidilobaceae archaeon]MDW7974429.1 dihydrolipoamide acetyltransferase family protein [Sulfolobales archaeon]
MEVRLPDIGEGLTEGEIVEWLVKEGDRVKQFQPLVKVLTAKATVEIPSPFEGVVTKLLAKPGDVVKVGEVIAEISKEGEAKPAVGTGEEGAQAAVIRAPPRVRKLARELGVDLASVRGTGPGGVITESDVMRAAEEMRRAVVKAEKPVTVPQQSLQREERIALRGIKRLMASKMVEAKAKIPHAYIAEEVDFTELVKLRESLKEEAEKKGARLTLLAFIVKALTKALKSYPLMNASLDEGKGEIVIKRFYNIGIAVDTEEGLVVPNIKDADKKGLFQIAREIQELSQKAREGKLSLEDVSNGTFSITNIGSIGTVFGMAVINYPEAAILGVHRIQELPRAVDGKVELRKVGIVTLSFDHRFIEGAYATRFLLHLKRLLENPVLIMAPEEEFK